MSHGMNSQDIGKPLFMRGNDVPFYHNWFATDSIEAKRGGTAPEGTRDKSKRYQTLENEFGTEASHPQTDAFKVGQQSRPISRAFPVRPESRKQIETKPESRGIKGQTSQIAKIYSTAKPPDKNSRSRQSRQDSRELISVNDSGSLLQHKPVPSAVSKNNFTGPLYEKSSNYSTWNQAESWLTTSKENLSSVFEQKESFPPFMKQNNRPMTGHGKRHEPVVRDKQANTLNSLATVEKRTLGNDNVQDDPWDFEIYDGVNEVVGKQQKHHDKDPKEEGKKSIAWPEFKLNEPKNKKLDVIEPLANDKSSFLNHSNNIDANAHPHHRTQNNGDDDINPEKNKHFFENAFKKEEVMFDFDDNENNLHQSITSKKDKPSNNAAFNKKDFHDTRAYRPYTAFEVSGNKNEQKEKVVFTKKFAKAKQILDSKLVPKRYAEDEINRFDDQAPKKEAEEDEKLEPAISEQNLALLNEINSQRPPARKKGQALNLGDEVEPNNSRKKLGNYTNFPCENQPQLNERPPSRHRTPSKALGLDLPEGETISFPVKNMYSNDARKEGDQQKDLDPLAAIPKTRGERATKPREYVNDLDVHDYDHVINLSDFLDSNDEDAGRNFVTNPLNDFDSQEDHDAFFEDEPYERTQMSRPMTHNPAAMRGGSFDNRPDTANKIERRTMLDFNKSSMSSTQGFASKPKPAGINRLDLDSVLPGKKRNDLDLEIFDDDFDQNPFPDRDSVEMNPNKKKLRPNSSKNSQIKSKGGSIISKGESPMFKDNFLVKNPSQYNYSYRNNRSNIVITHNKSSLMRNTEDVTLPFETSLGKDFVSLFAK